MLYPTVNLENGEVWWYPSDTLKGYNADLINNNYNIIISLNENGDIIRPPDTVGHTISKGKAKDIPEKMRKDIFSVFKDAERILFFPYNDSVDYKEYAEAWFSLSRYKDDSDADNHGVDIIFRNMNITSIDLYFPDNALLPVPIQVYLKKNHSGFFEGSGFKVEEEKEEIDSGKISYEIIIGTNYCYGEHLSLSFNSSGEFLYSSPFRRHCNPKF